MTVVVWVCVWVGRGWCGSGSIVTVVVWLCVYVSKCLCGSVSGCVRGCVCLCDMVEESLCGCVQGVETCVGRIVTAQ